MATDMLKKISAPLVCAFMKMTTKADMFNFLRDLLTEDEIKEFSQRLDIAKRLQAGQYYKHIEQETGVSSTTIARVAKFLKGKYGGYKKVFK